MIDTAGVQIDVTKFTFALRAYKAATRKDLADVLSRAARNVAYRSSSFTPKASSAQIRSSLMKDEHLRFALTSIALKKRGVGILKKPEFAKEVARFVSRRASSAAYLRAAYAKAIEQLGGSFRGARFKGAGGFANKATASRLIAEIVAIVSQPDQTHASSAERIGIQALKDAIEFVSSDMLNYAQQKMAQTAARHSG